MQRDNGAGMKVGSFGRQFFALNGSCRSAPEPIRCAPKSQSKECHHNCSEGRNCSVILAGGHSGAGYVQFEPNDRFDEEAAFFVKGMIGLVALAFVYALLKRF